MGSAINFVADEQYLEVRYVGSQETLWTYGLTKIRYTHSSAAVRNTLRIFAGFYLLDKTEIDMYIYSEFVIKEVYI